MAITTEPDKDFPMETPEGSRGSHSPGPLLRFRTREGTLTLKTLSIPFWSGRRKSSNYVAGVKVQTTPEQKLIVIVARVECLYPACIMHVACIVAFMFLGTKHSFNTGNS